MDLQGWAVGRRGFNTLIIFVLMAGEIYTTFTFLGASGFAYAQGAASYYILAYGSVAYVLGFWVLPPIWRYAKQHELISQSEYFAHRYKSPALGIAIASLGIVALLPYLALQLEGLGLIVNVTSGGAISGTSAIWIGVTGLVLYVGISGIHASAWTAVLKDTLVLAVAIALGIWLPLHNYGSYEAMFKSIAFVRPGFLNLHGSHGPVWFISTVMVSALGFWMWPHAFTYTFSAREEKVFRRNAALLPVYQLLLLFIFFVGFAAIGLVPKLHDPDMALLESARLALPQWALGIIGGAGVLAALVPGSLLVMVIATLLAQNTFGLKHSASQNDQSLGLLIRLLIIPVAVVGAIFALSGSGNIVSLLLLGYSYITQIFPALIFGFGRRPIATRSGVFIGLGAGVAFVTAIAVTHQHLTHLFPWLPSAVAQLNVGIAALIVNAFFLLVVSISVRGIRFKSDRKLT